jgi:chromate transporter
VRELIDLTVSFFRIGVFGFGGGPSMIPLIEAEVVGLRAWMTKEEFLTAFAFGNALPGPIATKLAGYVGYHVAGPLGALVGLLALSVPTIVAMIALGGLYLKYRDLPAVAGFLKGVRPVVIALLALVVWEFVPSALGTPPQWWANVALWIIAVVAFVLSVRLGVHPAILIVAGGFVGIALYR